MRLPRFARNDISSARGRGQDPPLWKGNPRGGSVGHHDPLDYSRHEGLGGVAA
jgi:hypothetical protein